MINTFFVFLRTRRGFICWRSFQTNEARCLVPFLSAIINPPVHWIPVFARWIVCVWPGYLPLPSGFILLPCFSRCSISLDAGPYSCRCVSIGFPRRSSRPWCLRKLLEPSTSHCSTRIWHIWIRTLEQHLFFVAWTLCICERRWTSKKRLLSISFVCLFHLSLFAIICGRHGSTFFFCKPGQRTGQPASKYTIFIQGNQISIIYTVSMYMARKCVFLVARCISPPSVLYFQPLLGDCDEWMNVKKACC